MTKKQRNKLYKTALNGVENDEKYTLYGLCYALKIAFNKLKTPHHIYMQMNPYDIYRSNLTEYSLFFNPKTTYLIAN